MPTPHDVLQLKTDAELRFFVENSGYYQPELVDAARRELRRRGPAALAPTPAAPRPAAAPAPPTTAEPGPTAAAPMAPASGAYTPVMAEEPARRPWLLLGSIAAVVVVAGLGFWHRAPSPPAAKPLAASPKPVHQSAPPTLETAVTFPLPTYDTEAYVKKSLALLPVAEQKDAPHADQYRAISRCFWAAQNPSAHLIRQAQWGEANPMLEAQARSMLDLWYSFERTQVYHYKFEPGMADHLTRMKTIARYQREAIGELANDCAAQRPPVLDDVITLSHQQAIPALLAPLEPQLDATKARR